MTMRFCLVFSYILIACNRQTHGITTIHHDKPEESKIPTMASHMVEDSTITNPVNITLTPQERQKRLLPYENFYLRQRFNVPYNEGYNTMGAQRYQFEASTKKPTYVQYTKYNADNQQEVWYQQHNKFTPFLESNAIPGPFRPMANPPQTQKIKVAFVQVPQQQDSKIPNFSAIYDKLSQLKLVQRRPTYVQNYRIPPQRYTSQSAKPHVSYIPINNYEQPIQPTKTVIEMYTATNIDIPTASDAGNYYNEQESYEQIPTPIRTYENQGNVKTYTQVRKPYSQQVIVTAPPTTYAQQNYQPEKEVIRKPIIILQQKPIVNDHPKVYHYRGQTIQTVPISKPVVYVPRKHHYIQKPVPLVTEEYVPEQKLVETPQYVTNMEEKYETVPKYAPNVKYQVAQYEEVYQEEKPTQAQEDVHVTPKYEQTVESYEQFPPPQKYEDYEPVSEVVQVQTQSTTNDLGVILKQLQDTNTLPQTLTPENIDNSIKTLVRILGALRKKQKQNKPIVVPEESPDYNEEHADEHHEHVPGTVIQSFPADTPDGGTPGKPGVDYPALSSIPKTTFNCKTQRYKGFFGDPDTNCQVWHYCDLNGGQASFLCPNGTIFSQVALTCDWWYNVKCASTAQLYVLNERLYKYILPLSPKFPEDYSGPLVDKYLALKFQELEEKMKKEKKGKQEEDKEAESEELQNIEEEDDSKETPKAIKEEETESTTQQDNIK